MGDMLCLYFAENIQIIFPLYYFNQLFADTEEKATRRKATLY
jgi:hypothetical protein